MVLGKDSGFLSAEEVLALWPAGESASVQDDDAEGDLLRHACAIDDSVLSSADLVCS